MEGNLLSISKIFTEKLLRIPDYQRGYAWTIKEVNEYWSDLLQLEEGKSHYVGVLTLEDVPREILQNWKEDQWIINARGYSSYYVVDGQQRLTTTIILIQAIVETIEDSYDFDEDELILNYNSLKEIRSKYIYLSRDKGLSRSYIFGYEKDNPSYEFLKVNIFKEKSINHNLLEETIYTTNLLNAKNSFKSYLSEMTKEEIENIYKKVTQHFVFNIYSLDKEIDTYVAFETMNNRGKSLSHLELLKNRLIFLTTKLKDDSYEKENLRHSINECWKSVYHYLGKSKDNPLDDDEFLYGHFSLHFDRQILKHPKYGEIMIDIDRREYKSFLLEDVFTQKSLLSENNDKKIVLSSEYINKYVSSLKSSVEHWHDIYNPSSDKIGDQVAYWLETIHRNPRWNTRASTLILAFFSVNDDQQLRVEFLKSLERKIFVEANLLGQVNTLYLFGSDNNVNHQVLAKRLFKQEITASECISLINSNTDSLIKEYKTHWGSEFIKDSNFYNWSGTRSVLFEYERHLCHKYKADRMKLTWKEFSKHEPSSDYETIEHIYPQRARAQYWVERFSNLSNQEKKKLKNTIGNLVPLSRRKNSQLSNRPFHEKVELGFKYGCYSEIEVAQNNEWGPDEIINRTIKLIKFMDKRWRLGISTNQSSNSEEIYLKFSGLSELNKNSIKKKN
ncbi:DUF262 domain-containing protein [Vibrio cholerae]|uniref:DUF262 domain-containing protein n=1 Tax=Vibrio cholerae TaxID=666 RepID=UPI002DBFA8F9|nr:DUF262 domain-containing protein [Vibrio cholerae]